MMNRATGRIPGLALFLDLSSVGAVSAHALPGRILTFSQSDNDMLLSTSLPLEDLVTASPAFDALGEAPLDTDRSPDLEHLGEYFASHITLENKATDVPLTIEHPMLHSARDEHGGQYTALALSFKANVSATDGDFPMTLTYDAVMHEVRNHQAMVFRVSPGKQTVMIASFGFRPVNGAQQPVLLSQPRGCRRPKAVARKHTHPACFAKPGKSHDPEGFALTDNTCG